MKSEFESTYCTALEKIQATHSLMLKISSSSLSDHIKVVILRVLQKRVNELQKQLEFYGQLCNIVA